MLKSKVLIDGIENRCFYPIRWHGVDIRGPAEVLPWGAIPPPNFHSFQIPKALLIQYLEQLSPQSVNYWRLRGGTQISEETMWIMWNKIRLRWGDYNVDGRLECQRHLHDFDGIQRRVRLGQLALETPGKGTEVKFVPPLCRLLLLHTLTNHFFGFY